MTRSERKSNPPQIGKGRALVVAGLFSFLFLVVAARAFQIQILQQPELMKKAERQYRRSLEFDGKRGRILDTNEAPIAVSMDAYSIAIRPQEIPDRKSAAKKLARALHQNEARIRKKIAGDRFTWLARRVGPATRKRVEALHLPGIEVVTETSRAYPGKGLAAQVIGFTGTDGKGLEGLEYRFNEALKGEKQDLSVIRDAGGRWFKEGGLTADPPPGKDIVLTLDKTIQFIAESALSDAAKQYDAASGMAIVMAPKTGAIRAIAHYPQYNPNTFGNYPPRFWQNRAVTEPFEPGSTLKVFLAAGAIHKGYCRPDSIYYCGNGSYKIGPVTVHDTKPHEWLSVSQIIKYSSNIGAVKISEVTGAESLHAILKDFGFGEKSGIEASSETKGILRPWPEWTQVDTGNIAFGQGISTSAIQLTAAVSAIANGGRLMRPYLIEEIRDPKTGRHQKREPEIIRQVVSPDAAAIVRQMMESVTEEGGTGTQSVPVGYRVAGKTGTSQKLGANGKYSKKHYIASFLGFAPLENPELAVLVVLDEPRANYYGGTVAAPVFREIVAESLAYMNIRPRQMTAAVKAKDTDETL